MIIYRPGRSNGPFRVTIIDFNLAYVPQRCEDGRQMIAKTGHRKGLPPSIIERYWFGEEFAYGGEYSEWIPKSWVVEDDPFLPAARWLVDMWIGSPGFRPPSEEFLNRPFHQNLDEPLLQVLEKVKAFVAKDRRLHG